MANGKFQLAGGHPRIVGSFGSLNDLCQATLGETAAACDIAELRLDLLQAEGKPPEPSPWKQLQGFPLLFTARRKDEGGALEMDDTERADLLFSVLDEAALVDIEVASIGAMGGLIAEMKSKGVPWIASFHDFEKLPERETLVNAAAAAREAGAMAFKVAARISSPAEVARLADFQLEDHGILVSSMGMGPLAPVSRLLCAQCGSVLNYGFLGKTATAPGQWDAAMLRNAVGGLAPFKIQKN